MSRLTYHTGPWVYFDGEQAIPSEWECYANCCPDKPFDMTPEYPADVMVELRDGKEYHLPCYEIYGRNERTLIRFRRKQTIG